MRRSGAMAEKRMFSCKITSSDSFKMMSLPAQALYFHLGMEADDDGFVNNSVSIARSIGASIEDIEEIVSNRFAIRLSSKLLVIKHWKINNYIQKDRYHETAYKQYKDQLTVKDNDSYTEKDKSDTRWSADGYRLDTDCVQVVSKMDTEIRLGKNRLDYTSLPNGSLVGEEASSSPQKNQENTDLFGEKIEMEQENVPYKTIAEYWNKSVKGKVSQIRELTEQRKILIKERWYEYHNEVYSTIDKVASSDFFMQWKACGFDWCFQKKNFVKILEGNYDNNRQGRIAKGNGKSFRPRDINGQYDNEELEELSEL